MLGVPGTNADERDGFYDLVIAARNKAIEVEPEPPPPPRLPDDQPGIPGHAGGAVLFGLVLLEHGAIVDLIPASAGLFKLIGM